PSGTSSLPTTPSSAASTSMVALSVSISAITSPALTWSPSLTSHLASVPSVIVGESAGMAMVIGICPPRSGRLENVGVKLGRIGLRAVLGELRGLGDDLLHLAVELLEPGLVRRLVLDDAVAQAVDRVALLADLLHFLARAVLRRVGHRVAAV